jgi:hypothetical protein
MATPRRVRTFALSPEATTRRDTSPMTEIADAARNRRIDGAHNANMMRGS